MERYQQDYDVNLEYAFMYESEHGPYVLYKDHMAVVQKLEERVRELEDELSYYESQPHIG